MSGRMKGRHTDREKYIEIIVGIPGIRESIYKIPNTPTAKQSLKVFLQKLIVSDEETTSWEELAADRIKRYTEAGLALRGARYREGISQKELAKQCGISQENLSKMENGKRVIGEKAAKKLAKALRIDYRLLMCSK